jgi:hypothetical protein
MADNTVPTPDEIRAQHARTYRPSWVPPDASAPGSPSAPIPKATIYPVGHPMHVRASGAAAPSHAAVTGKQAAPEPSFEDIRVRYAMPKLQKPPR